MTRYYDKDLNKYFVLPSFAQLPCFYQLVKQLFNNANPELIVNEK